MHMLAIWLLSVSMACHGIAHVTGPRRAKLAADAAFKTHSLPFPYVLSVAVTALGPGGHDPGQVSSVWFQFTVKTDINVADLQKHEVKLKI